MKSITVFCGASSGVEPIYAEEAKKIGRFLAEKKIEVVFGGGKIGIMGVVADAALQSGGRVTGVIPAFLRTKEVAHETLTTMHVVRTMHQRKMLMHQLSDAVLALPGGFGTLEELFEMLTWAQLGLHPKPIGLLNVNGYFDHLMAFVYHMHDEGFLSTANRDMLLVHDEAESLLQMMEEYTAPDTPQWINEAEI